MVACQMISIRLAPKTVYLQRAQSVRYSFLQVLEIVLNLDIDTDKTLYDQSDDFRLQLWDSIRDPEHMSLVLKVALRGREVVRELVFHHPEQDATGGWYASEDRADRRVKSLEHHSPGYDLFAG